MPKYEFLPLSFRLGQLVSVVLSRATLSDHLFLLNHVMRCPAGVGEWAAKFIQPQAPNLDLNDDDSYGHSFDNPYIDNLLTMLSTMLLKVKGREELLKELRVTRPPPPSPSRIGDPDDSQDAIFTVLDSEGEEDVEPWTSWSLLRENDLVQLLTQARVSKVGAPDLRVYGQTVDKDGIKRGQSVTKEWIYPRFRHSLSSSRLSFHFDLT